LHAFDDVMQFECVAHFSLKENFIFAPTQQKNECGMSRLW